MRKKIVALSLTLALALAPGCIVACPVAAFSGEPYGQTRDDWKAIGGSRAGVFGGHPVLAAIDLPFAAVLDTGFLPIALIVWGLKSLGGGGRDDDHGHSHDGDEDHGHSHDDGEADDHEHEAAPPPPPPPEPAPPRHGPDWHSHGGYEHEHEGGRLPHQHDQ